MLLTIDMKNLSAEDAAEYLHARVEAMCRGEVYVKAHFRAVPRWGALGSKKRLARQARYAKKLLGSTEAAAKFLKIEEATVREAVRRKRAR